MNIMNKKPLFIALRVTLITFVIGNVIAWISGAAPIKFAEIPFSTAEQSLIADGATSSATEKDAQSIAMIYFLHNRLDEAAAMVEQARAEQGASDSLTALAAAIEVKQAGARLDLLFGQRKLWQLKQALTQLKSVSDKVPEQFDVQLLALWAFASVPDISDSAANAQIISHRLTPVLNRHGIPQPLAASAWLGLTRLSLYLAEEGDEESQVSAQANARMAWQAYQQIGFHPAWLQQESDVLEQEMKELPEHG
jgi:hypothetical protein